MALGNIFRVLIVEDFEPFRRAVRFMLEKRPILHIVSEASDGVEAVQMAEALQPDFVLLDIGLPKLNGIQAARQIREVAPKAKMIFVTQECSPDIAQEAFKIGAVAYVLKMCAATDLLARRGRSS